MLKLIAAPFPDEREAVFTQVNRRRSLGEPKGYRMVIPADGADLKQCLLSSSGGKGWPLRFALASVLGIDEMEVVADPKLLAITFDADALVRPDTPSEKLLPALQAELKAKCGIDLTLEFKQMEREVVTVSGTYSNRAARNQVEPAHVYTLDTDEPNDKPNNTAHLFNTSFFPAVAVYLGRPVIDETNIKSLRTIQFTLNEYHHVKADDPAYKAPDVKAVLQRLANQTDLKFELGKKKVRALVVTKADKEPDADKSYSLKDGEVLKLIAAPFPEERKTVYPLHPNFKQLGDRIPFDQLLLPVTVENGKPVVVGGGMARGADFRPGGTGMPLSELFTILLRFDLTSLSDPDWLLQSTRVDCDVLLKKGATPEEWVPALRKELKAKWGVDLVLEFREAETEVVVIRGKHTLKPVRG